MLTVLSGGGERSEPKTLRQNDDDDGDDDEHYFILLYFPDNKTRSSTRVLSEGFNSLHVKSSDEHDCVSLGGTLLLC